MKLQNEKNTVRHHAKVTRSIREARNGHKSAIIWFTGLSGSGKSTLSHVIEEKLHQLGCHTYVFDGDNIRQGLCADLAFSEEDRSENIRRIGEMCKLFYDAGIIVITAFISPIRKDRRRVRSLVCDEDFIEIYCRCSLEVCEQRDTKGFYKKARAGEIKNYTGISSPYEEPEHTDLVLDTDTDSLEKCVDRVISFLKERGVNCPH